MPLVCRILAFIVVALSLGGCGGGGGGSIGSTGSNNPDPPVNSSDFTSLIPILEGFEAQEFAFALGDANGIQMTFSRGDTSIDEVKRIASASKWFTSSVILALVEQGVMALDDHPQDYIDWWTDDPSDPRSRITLSQLLSLTSGFALEDEKSSCIYDETSSLTECVRQIYDTGTRYEPGTVFFYNASHLQIAGLMAEVASGQSFQQLFEMLVAAPLNMTKTKFGSDNTENPLLAGGFVSSVRDTAKWLQAVSTGQLLSSLRDEWEADRTDEPVRIEQSPLNALKGSPGGMELGLAWHYALGHWRECPQAVWDESCAPVEVVSSPGALGWYPWIDYATGCYGVVGIENLDVGSTVLNSLSLGHDVRQELSRLIAAGVAECAKESP